MRKIFLILLTFLLAYSKPSMAIDGNAAQLISLTALNPATTTQGNITTMLGKPEKVEESKKTTKWHYTLGTTDVVISWNKKTERFEKFSFNCTNTEKCVFDTRLSHKLRSGTTDIAQTINLLGAPQAMVMKNATQEMHYTYQKNVLRLFFRDHILVDFTLLGQPGQ